MFIYNSVLKRLNFLNIIKHKFRDTLRNVVDASICISVEECKVERHDFELSIYIYILSKT